MTDWAAAVFRPTESRQFPHRYLHGGRRGDLVWLFEMGVVAANGGGDGLPTHASTVTRLLRNGPATGSRSISCWKTIGMRLARVRLRDGHLRALDPPCARCPSSTSSKRRVRGGVEHGRPSGGTRRVGIGKAAGASHQNDAWLKMCRSRPPRRLSSKALMADPYTPFS